MPTTARVVVLEGDFGVCAIQELELPDPGPHQAVLEIYAAGIEHGQLQQVEESQPLPLIPGREGTARLGVSRGGSTLIPRVARVAEVEEGEG